MLSFHYSRLFAGSINRNSGVPKANSLLQPPPPPPLAASASAGAEPDHQRKRTRGVECSIAKAMALKEKRSSIGLNAEQQLKKPKHDPLSLPPVAVPPTAGAGGRSSSYWNTDLLQNSEATFQDTPWVHV